MPKLIIFIIAIALIAVGWWLSTNAYKYGERESDYGKRRFFKIIELAGAIMFLIALMLLHSGDE